MSANGYIDLKNLDQIGNPIVERKLALPDGRKFLVKMRGLSSLEMREIRNSIAWPEMPTNFEKGADGVVRKVPLTTGPAYQQYVDAYEVATNRQMCIALLRSLQVEVAGETDDEKLHTLETKIGSGVLVALMTYMNELNAQVTAGEIEEAKND